jgi:hypothetical protein
MKKDGVLRVFAAVPSVALAKDGEGLGSEVRTNGQIQLPLLFASILGQLLDLQPPVTLA